MSTTTPRTLKAGADVRLRDVYESYVRALGDLDKAGDVEDAAYYQGEVDAYLDVLDTFGELEPEASSAAETEIRARLEYLRGEIQAERISYYELAELQGLAAHIEEGDVELLQWAGVPEHPDVDEEYHPGSGEDDYDEAVQQERESAEARAVRLSIETGGNYA